MKTAKKEIWTAFEYAAPEGWLKYTTVGNIMFNWENWKVFLAFAPLSKLHPGRPPLSPHPSYSPGNYSYYSTFSIDSLISFALCFTHYSWKTSLPYILITDVMFFQILHCAKMRITLTKGIKSKYKYNIFHLNVHRGEYFHCLYF